VNAVFFATLSLHLEEYQLSPASTHEDDPHESSSLLSPGRNGGKNTEQQVKIVKGLLYAVQVFYSFFIM
jgi:hypothetical protein